ncbi:unannotated protein [freshwater metagenome]|uniref:Unannotated protein n=1 Tax=freshwater metagenome TaxID=449393 RepID=A0A6J7E1C6_9ZZZZ|nr:DUF2867 domain-containing protein [Actinomycetota bacterium]
MAPVKCLVTGATGYVGGRLIPQLLADGHDVRVMVRHPERLRDFPWIDQVEVAVADAGDQEAVERALEGVDVAYYLMHSLGSGPDFEATEARIAQAFALAAQEAQLARIIYLGGLTHDEDLSAHMKSRLEVEEILLTCTVPTIVLRAAVIIGSGSLSFEMVRYLTERLPAMVTPKWVNTATQPIAIRDVLRYLVGCAGLPGQINRAFDIGGPDVITYEEMMQQYARTAGLRKRLIVNVPVLTPRLSSRWVGVVTPLPIATARPLVDSLRNESVCQEHDIAELIPDPDEGLLGFADAVSLALQRIKDAQVVTRWSQASVSGVPSDPLPTDPDWAGGSLYTDEREGEVDASPEQLWAVIEGVGGKNGWYSFPFAWEIRGLFDRVSGGVGLRRGRRDPRHLMVGEPLDFWRVEELIPGQLLRLRAEMKLPGLAWLELEVRTSPTGKTLYHQRAIFYPRGLAGHTYWWSISIFHAFVFGGMVRNISKAAKSISVAHS